MILIQMERILNKTWCNKLEEIFNDRETVTKEKFVNNIFIDHEIFKKEL